MKIKMLVGLAGNEYALSPGDEREFPDAEAIRMLADNNSATAGARVASAVALNSASLNQPVSIQKSGDITIGATLTPGVVYYTSDTPGGICPVADLASGEYPQIVGIAKSATVLSLGFKSAGVAL
jgi:hypothetical protein